MGDNEIRDFENESLPDDWTDTAVSDVIFLCISAPYSLSHVDANDKKAPRK